MTDRFLCIGYGSIGRRHARNLTDIMPTASIVVVDPLYGETWIEEALDYPDLRGAIVATPTSQHLDPLLLLQEKGIPVYLEKPVCTIEEWGNAYTRDHLGYLARQPWKCAVGFQYRYHPVIDRLHSPRTDHLSFNAQDDLIAKYGATVAETMASHSIDLALFAQGPARTSEFYTDGKTFNGTIFHTSGASSDFDLRIDRGPRQSSLAVTYERGGSVNLTIEADDQMYRRALEDWLRWVMARQSSARLARLGDGLRVMELISGAKQP
jgi:predicted dehydrogenase